MNWIINLNFIKSLKHHLLILETLKDKVTLLIFKFSNFVIGTHIIIVQTLAQIVAWKVPGVEHVSAQIEHCPFVDFIVFVVNDRFRRIWSDELLDAAREVALPLSYRWETLFVEIAEADEDVH